MWVWASGSKPRSNKAVIGNKGVKPESIIKPDRWIDYSSIKKHNTNHISIANTLLFPTLYPSLSISLIITFTEIRCFLIIQKRHNTTALLSGLHDVAFACLLEWFCERRIFAKLLKPTGTLMTPELWKLGVAGGGYSSICAPGIVSILKQTTHPHPLLSAHRHSIGDEKHA